MGYSTDLNVNVTTTGASEANKQLGSVEKSIKTLSKAIIGFATINTLTKVASGAIEVAHAYDDVADAAERMGMSVSQFQALSYAGKDVGLSAESMSRMFLSAEKSMVKLQTTGKGGLANALKALGDQTKLTTADFQNLSGQEGLQKLKDEMDRLNVSHRDQVSLLEQMAKGSSKLIPLLDDQGSKLKQLIAIQNELNSTLGLTDDQVEAMSRLDAAANRTGAAFDMAKTKMVGAFANILTANADMATSVIQNFGSMIDAAIVYFDTLDNKSDDYLAQLKIKQNLENDMISQTEELSALELKLAEARSENNTRLVQNLEKLLPGKIATIELTKQEAAENQKLIDTHLKKINAVKEEVKSTITLHSTSVNASKDAQRNLELELQMRRDFSRITMSLMKEVNRELMEQFVFNIGEMDITTKDFFSSVAAYKNAETDSVMAQNKMQLQNTIDTLNESIKHWRLVGDEQSAINTEVLRDQAVALQENNAALLVITKQEVENNVTARINGELDYWKQVMDIRGDAQGSVWADTQLALQKEIDLRMKGLVWMDQMSDAERAKEVDAIRQDVKKKTDMYNDYYSNLYMLQRLQASSQLTTAPSDSGSVFSTERTIEAQRELSIQNEIWYRTELQKLDEYHIKYATSEEDHLQHLEDLQKSYNEMKSNQANQYRAEMLSSQSNFMGSITSIGDATLQAMEAFGGRTGASYKRMFALTKGFALATSIINMQAAIAGAAVTGLSPAEKLANMAAIASAVGGVISTIAGMKYSPREQGGQFGRGTYLVGEKGPELVQFGAGGRIANNSDTNKMLNGGSTITQNVNIINNTPANVSTRREDNGDLTIMVQEMMQREVLNPNSNFNKNLNKTRKIERRI